MERVKQIIIVAAIVLIPGMDLLAQRLPVAKKVDITIDQNRAVIHYDIKSKKEKEAHLVELKFLDKDYNLVTPTLLSGDIGPAVAGGLEKTIIWDITHDVELLDSDITPVIFIDGASRQFSNTGGASNALLSMIIPGLGDYFVADRRMMIIKPYVRTVSSLGLIGLGIWVGNQRYLSTGGYQTFMREVWHGYPEYQYVREYYDKFVEGDIQYKWFKGDAELLIGLGAAIWAADVIWVLAKGSNNVKFLKASYKGSQFQLGYLPGGAGLRYSFTF